jgi:hypothetical protein
MLHYQWIARKKHCAKINTPFTVGVVQEPGQSNTEEGIFGRIGVIDVGDDDPFRLELCPQRCAPELVVVGRLTCRNLCSKCGVIGNTVQTNETQNKAQFLKSLHSRLVPHHVHIGCHRLLDAGARTCSGAGGGGLLALSLLEMVAHNAEDKVDAEAMVCLCWVRDTAAILPMVLITLELVVVALGAVVTKTLALGLGRESLS